jgi:hypothetical protein
MFWTSTGTRIVLSSAVEGPGAAGNIQRIVRTLGGLGMTSGAVRAAPLTTPPDRVWPALGADSAASAIAAAESPDTVSDRVIGRLHVARPGGRTLQQMLL